ncbi:glycosyltransferase family 1 protein [Actinomadura craniellae]|uniref:Glycosyltransferase family 1 protein n=1 Tax=Actinomadura craniellae TaxID=2231787 RepID=A0A365GX73_9ACTN|nr:glycosyltransferase [Actinomadura craniellae]RAY11392.1 glycosyltransferase family 1 protein [Actinomadura craniellae]
MRVLHVNKFLYRRGGAESYMLDLAERQRARGDEVAFYAMTHPENDPAAYAARFPAHLEMNPLPPGVTGKISGAGRMLWSTSARRGLAQVIADFRPDVAHAHNIYHQLSPSVLAALRAAGVPVVMTLHDYKLACPSYSFLDQGRICTACVGGGFRQAVRRRCKGGSLAASAAVAVESWAHRRLGAYNPVGVFVCPSRFLTMKLIDAGVYPDRLTVLDHFVAPGPAPVDPVPGRLVVAGRLSHEKGVDLAIRALPVLPPGTRLDIAGDGPERAALTALAEATAPGQVTFHGRLPKAGVLELMNSAAALLLPSRWYENQPMTILEAFACGTPVIGANLGGIPELITDGVTGRLVQPDSPTALAEAAAPFLLSAQARDIYGKAARDVATTRFAPDTHLAALDAIYASAGNRLSEERREPRAD